MAETKRMTCEQVVGYLLEGEGLDFLRESLGLPGKQRAMVVTWLSAQLFRPSSHVYGARPWARGDPASRRRGISRLGPRAPDLPRHGVGRKLDCHQRQHPDGAAPIRFPRGGVHRRPLGESRWRRRGCSPLRRGRHSARLVGRLRGDRRHADHEGARTDTSGNAMTTLVKYEKRAELPLLIPSTRCNRVERQFEFLFFDPAERADVLACLFQRGPVPGLEIVRRFDSPHRPRFRSRHDLRRGTRRRNFAVCREMHWATRRVDTRTRIAISHSGATGRASNEDDRRK
jgi:hypothetical protein